MQEIVAAQLAGDYLGGTKGFRADGRQQIVDQDGFAGANLAGDDDKALGVVQAVDQIGHRLPVHAALKKKPGIGGQLKRPRRELVEFRVHRLKTPWSGRIEGYWRRYRPTDR